MKSEEGRGGEEKGRVGGDKKGEGVGRGREGERWEQKEGVSRVSQH